MDEEWGFCVPASILYELYGAIIMVISYKVLVTTTFKCLVWDLSTNIGLFHNIMKYEDFRLYAKYSFSDYYMNI